MCILQILLGPKLIAARAANDLRWMLVTSILAQPHARAFFAVYTVCALLTQERKSIEKAGLAVHRLRGGELTAAHWDRFYEFYLSTVDRKWGNAYLTRDFFQQLGATMPDQVIRMCTRAGGRGVWAAGQVLSG